MNKNYIKNNIHRYPEIIINILGVAFFVSLFVGWGWYIWCLSSGFVFWDKVLWVLGSYVLCGVFIAICSLPGVGCIPVKFDNSGRK